MDDREQSFIASRWLSRNAPRFLVGALVATIVLSGAGLALYREFVSTFDQPAPDLPAHVDVIVVLSGGAGRLDEGLRLLRDGRAPLLYLVGFQPKAVAARLGGEAAVARLTSEGRVLVEPRSDSTLEDAERTRALVDQRNARAILVITSVYHVQRADLTFRTILPAEVAVHLRPVRSAAFRGGDWQTDEPSRRIVVGEFVKYVAYRVRLAFR